MLVHFYTQIFIKFDPSPTVQSIFFLYFSSYCVVCISCDPNFSQSTNYLQIRIPFHYAGTFFHHMFMLMLFLCLNLETSFQVIVISFQLLLENCSIKHRDFSILMNILVAYNNSLSARCEQQKQRSGKHCISCSTFESAAKHFLVFLVQAIPLALTPLAPFVIVLVPLRLSSSFTEPTKTLKHSQTHTSRGARIDLVP